ncbi:hypothetical protein [Cytobacillus dafuensis]|uniref:GNAT family N-acetyltransferase n=1 Tax=Cytobacillus dafuensis TaxID=1742359 RepID=A0A5B8Z1D3_CYTDA|nr:hypothetical protein [Cytobacillus dafuensis]QED46824.1 GNAT family N-acetyltransferase [Cytobacillus dafuensis]
MNPIYEGTLIKDGQAFPYTVQLLTMDHLPEILLVQEQVVSHLNEKNILQPLTEEEFQFILEGNGLMIGAFVEEELIAFRALLEPIIDSEHLGIDIGLPESELKKVIYQELSNVLPAYRGNQLQKILASLIMKELGQQSHSYRYVCCTVAPFNIPSLKDKFSQGMRIAALKEKYGGSMRYIFVKDLEESGEQGWGDSIFIPMKEITAQRSQLALGWLGIQMVEREGELLVEYVK